MLGEELTLGETDGIFTALGVERGTAMELALSRPDAETYFSDVPEKAASVGVFVRIRSGGEGLSLLAFQHHRARRPPLRRRSPPPG